MRKLYCYVDETGQDTRSNFFFVSLIIADSERDTLRTIVKEIEMRSWKADKKWTKSTIKQRIAYITEIINLPYFKGSLFFQRFEKPTNYLSCTVEAIFNVLNRKALPGDKYSIFIDALNKHDRKAVSILLRRHQMKVVNYG